MVKSRADLDVAEQHAALDELLVAEVAGEGGGGGAGHVQGGLGRGERPQLLLCCP